MYWGFLLGLRLEGLISDPGAFSEGSDLSVYRRSHVLRVDRAPYEIARDVCFALRDIFDFEGWFCSLPSIACCLISRYGCGAINIRHPSSVTKATVAHSSRVRLPWRVLCSVAFIWPNLISEYIFWSTICFRFVIKWILCCILKNIYIYKYAFPCRSSGGQIIVHANKMATFRLHYAYLSPCHLLVAPASQMHHFRALNPRIYFADLGEVQCLWRNPCFNEKDDSLNLTLWSFRYWLLSVDMCKQT